MTPINAVRSFVTYLLDNTDEVPIHLNLNSEYDAGGQRLQVEKVNVDFSSYGKAGVSETVDWREMKINLHVLSANSETAQTWTDQLITALKAGAAPLMELVEGSMVDVPNRFMEWLPNEATDFEAEMTSTHAYWYTSFNARFKN